jgi:Domain of unknown function (DUF6046)
MDNFKIPNEKIEVVHTKIDILPIPSIHSAVEAGARIVIERAMSNTAILQGKGQRLNGSPIQSESFQETTVQADDANNTRYFAYKGNAPFTETSITFESVTYTNQQGKSITTPQLEIAQILVSVTFPRNIVKTQIQGRNGTVKEYIGEGDASISFRGVLTAKNGASPKDQINTLKQIMDAPVAIPVSSSYLQNLNIYSVVFEDRTLEQEEGGYSYQSFTINAVSDIPQELDISNV